MVSMGLFGLMLGSVRAEKISRQDLEQVEQQVKAQNL